MEPAHHHHGSDNDETLEAAGTLDTAAELGGKVLVAASTVGAALGTQEDDWQPVLWGTAEGTQRTQVAALDNLLHTEGLAARTGDHEGTFVETDAVVGHFLDPLLSTAVDDHSVGLPSQWVLLHFLSLCDGLVLQQSAQAGQLLQKYVADPYDMVLSQVHELCTRDHVQCATLEGNLPQGHPSGFLLLVSLAAADMMPPVHRPGQNWVWSAPGQILLHAVDRDHPHLAEQYEPPLFHWN